MVIRMTLGLGGDLGARAGFEAGAPAAAATAGNSAAATIDTINEQDGGRWNMYLLRRLRLGSAHLLVRFRSESLGSERAGQRLVHAGLLRRQLDGLA